MLTIHPLVPRRLHHEYIGVKPHLTDWFHDKRQHVIGIIGEIANE
jgi:hypothetical protein